MRGVYEVYGWVSRVDDDSRSEWRYTIEADSLDDAMSRVVGSSQKLDLPTEWEFVVRKDHKLEPGDIIRMTGPCSYDVIRPSDGFTDD